MLGLVLGRSPWPSSAVSAVLTRLPSPRSLEKSASPSPSWLPDGALSPTPPAADIPASRGGRAGQFPFAGHSGILPKTEKNVDLVLTPH